MFVCGGVIVAQDMPSEAVMPAPKVLVVEREFVKPGRSGSIHEKSEAAFVSAMTAAKWPTHYLAAESMSGKPRVLFMIGYPSFADWEKDNQAMEKNTALSAAFDKAAYSDGDLLSDFTQGVLVLDQEGSLRAGDAVHARYFEISQFKVKPGHRAEWQELVKMYRDGMEAAVPTAHWALYESQYGEGNGGYYVVISTMKSLEEDDAGMNDDKKFAEYMGPDKMKHISELTAACLDSSQTNLFHLNPRMSYAADSWIKADAYWKPKTAPGAVKKTSAANP
jgi:hypothetical protein